MSNVLIELRRMIVSRPQNEATKPIEIGYDLFARAEHEADRICRPLMLNPELPFPNFLFAGVWVVRSDSSRAA